MKKIFFLITLFSLSFSVFSNPISITTLQKCAFKAYQQRNPNFNDNISIKTMDYFIDNGDTLMVMFHFTDEGFLVLSADDAAIPVLAYSTLHPFDMNDPTPGAVHWLDLYQAQIREIKKKNIAPDAAAAAAWHELITDDSGKGTKSIVVAPLITTMWGQGKYYNYYCPEDAEAGAAYDNKCPCGCVALSMAMLLYYYRYPTYPQGNAGTYTNYGYYFVNLSQQNYNYDAITDDIDFYNNEIAKLIWHCGISCGMNYAPDGSGAQSSDACDALKEHFKFKSTTKIIYRSEYSTSSWITKLKNNLNSLKPVYYSGYTEESAGHAFVCDGYDSDNLFHFNFGWSGTGNGYYVTGNVNEGVNGFYQWQCAIVDAEPAEDPEYCSTKKLTAAEGSFEDGSRNLDYQNNSNCLYTIAPNDAKTFYFKIISMDTQANVDTLSFWKGDPSQGELFATFSGNNYDGHDFSITNTDSVCITFKSNASETGAGWKLYYKITENQKNCIPYTIKTDLYGDISDGSSIDQPYDANVNCRWAIRPVNANAISIGFVHFDLSNEDLLNIYAREGNNLILKNTYSGNTIPEWKYYNTSQILVEFISDNYLQKTGFVLHWETNTEIEEIDDAEIFLYPNPASEFITIRLKNFTDPQQALITDMYGKQLCTFNLTQNETKVNISHFSSGIYLFSIRNKAGIFQKKFIKH